MPETDARKVEIDTEALTLGDVSAVTENLNLVTVGPKRGSAVSWTSSDTSVIETDGTVHRPLRDAEVTLTAAISKGEAKQTKTFVVTVKGTQPSRTIAGIEGSYFSGGTFYETNAVKFADLFEGDGANGTNGTVYVEPSTEPDAAEINKFPRPCGGKRQRRGSGITRGSTTPRIRAEDFPSMKRPISCRR